MITASDDETISFWGIDGIEIKLESYDEGVIIINAPPPANLDSDSENEVESSDDYADDSF